MSTDTKSVVARVIDIVAEQLGAYTATITQDTHFENDLNSDSLDQVEIVMRLEDEFDITIPDEQAEKVHTVGEAVDCVNQLLEAKADAN